MLPALRIWVENNLSSSMSWAFYDLSETCCLSLRLNWSMLHAFTYRYISWSIFHAFTSELGHVACILSSEMIHIACIYIWVEPCACIYDWVLHAFTSELRHVVRIFYNLRWSISYEFTSELIRIRIHRIHVFFGLPDPDPLVRGMDTALDPDPDPSIIMQK